MIDGETKWTKYAFDAVLYAGMYGYPLKVGYDILTGNFTVAGAVAKIGMASICGYTREVVKLADQAEEFKASNLVFAGLNTELRQSLDRADATNEALEGKVRDFSELFEKNKETMESLRASRDDLRAEVERLEKVRDSIVTNSAESQARLDEVTKQLETARENLAEENAKLKEVRESLEQTAARHEAAADGLGRPSVEKASTTFRRVMQGFALGAVVTAVACSSFVWTWCMCNMSNED